MRLPVANAVLGGLVGIYFGNGTCDKWRHEHLSARRAKSRLGTHAQRLPLQRIGQERCPMRLSDCSRMQSARSTLACVYY